VGTVTRQDLSVAGQPLANRDPAGDHQRTDADDGRLPSPPSVANLSEIVVFAK
jgi:hypothetical protein